MKFITFFLILWVIFALLDPDPDPHMDPGTPFESGSTAGFSLPFEQKKKLRNVETISPILRGVLSTCW